MPKNQFVKGDERAKAAGRKGGPLGGRPAKLNLKRVEAELPPLDSLEHAMERLDLIGKWALAGMVAGTTAGAAVRSVEVWLKAHADSLTRDVITDLKQDVARLKAQLIKPPMRVAR